MLNHDHDPPQEPGTKEPTTSNAGGSIRQLDTRRDEMRELLKEIDQEVTDSEQRRSDREDQ